MTSTTKEIGSGKLSLILLLLLSFTLVFEGMLFLTGRITVDEALIALGVRESEEQVVAALRDETLQSSELLLQWESLLNQRDLMRAEKRSLMQIEAQLAIDTDNVAAEQSMVRELMAAFSDTLRVRREGDIAKLAKLYNSMKPADAARVLNGLDSRLAAEVLARLKPRQSARILAALDSQRAVELSNILSGTPLPVSSPDTELSNGN
jgi:flagellar motility protein MotE (MotC chaperone)